MARAVKSAGSVDKVAVVNALAATKSYEGLFGTYDIDASRQPTYTGSLRQIAAGKVVEWTADSNCQV